MVTGIETAGLVLALLPLLVNQLDAYVQGIETIKSFRTRRYRRELDGHLARLGTQQAILLNTLEQLLEDVVDFEEDIQSLIQDPQGPLWRDAQFQAKLSTRLGRDHDVYVKSMTNLAHALQELSDKLGLNSVPGQKVQPLEPSKLEWEIKKFKDIFLKSVYADLFTKIDSANAILRTLTQQSLHREQAKKKRRAMQKPFSNHAKIRAHARCLHNAVVRGKCWTCPCKQRHVINIRIESPRLEPDERSDAHTAQPRFRLALSSISNDSSARFCRSWQEVETEPVEVKNAPITPFRLISEEKPTMKPPAAVKKVQFAFATTTIESLPPWPTAGEIPTSPPIADMCAALYRADLENNLQEPFGFLLDEADARHRYEMYLVKRLAKEVQTQSLEDLLASAWTRSRAQKSRSRMIFNRKDRLYLAATLASGVLDLHGSWLRAHWESRDILFADAKDGNTAMNLQPYVSWQVLNCAEEPGDARQLSKTVSALIRNEVLFPLGLALVELSLNEPLADLRQSEDDDPVEAVSKLKTATRLLQEVYTESGTRYGDVVDKCLFWPGPRDVQLDGQEFQQGVFESVVSPLLQDLRDFQGQSGIR